MTAKAPLWQVHAALLAGTAAIGTGFVATKLLLLTVTPMAWVTLRIGLTGLLLLLLFGRHLGRARLSARDHGRLALCALLGVVANQLLFAGGLGYTTPAHGALINGLVPLLTAVFGAMAARSRLSLQQLLGCALAMAGVGNLVGAGTIAASQWHGDLMMLANSIGYAAYLVISRPLFRRHGWQVAVPGVFLWTLPMVAPLALTQGVAPFWPALTGSNGTLVVFMILGPSVGSYVAFAWALQRLEAAQVALYGYLQPLIALLVGAWVLADPLSAKVLGSAALILGGMATASATAPLPWRRWLDGKTTGQVATRLLQS